MIIVVEDSRKAERVQPKQRPGIDCPRRAGIGLVGRVGGLGYGSLDRLILC